MDTFDLMLAAAVVLYGYRALRPFLRRRRSRLFEQETREMEESWRSIRADPSDTPSSVEDRRQTES